MKTLIPLFPFVAALGLLACQGDDGPVAKNAAAPPDNVVGDSGSSGLGTPANASAAEAADRAAAPMVDDGMAWSSAADGTVDFGPAGAKPALTLACSGTGAARHLLVTRADPAVAGATATMSFTGGGHASSLPMHAVAKPGGPGESEWQGEARGDMARAVGRAFAGGGRVNITLGGAAPLSPPASPLVTALIDRCA